MTDTYLDRFPPEHRETADRAYNDGFSDGVGETAAALNATEELVELAREMLAYEAAQFDGAPDVDLSVSGADLVDAFTAWRARLRAAVATVDSIE